jgi:hypothetical protein
MHELPRRRVLRNTHSVMGSKFDNFVVCGHCHYKSKSSWFARARYGYGSIGKGQGWERGASERELSWEAGTRLHTGGQRGKGRHGANESLLAMGRDFAAGYPHSEDLAF